MLFICQWILFVRVMQSPHAMKWNVNFVWATHRYAQEKGVGGFAAGFTFTITVMIQSSLIIIPLPRMSAVIAYTGFKCCIPTSCLAGLASCSGPADLYPAPLCLAAFVCTSNSSCLFSPLIHFSPRLAKHVTWATSSPGCVSRQ